MSTFLTSSHCELHPNTEGAGTFVRDKDCYNVTIGYTHVPAAISWISYDFYNPPAPFVKNEYEEFLYPKMAPHQRALLVPDASTSAYVPANAVNASRSGWSVPDMVARAHEYFAWAATDTSGKIIGLNPWHWKTVPFPGTVRVFGQKFALDDAIEFLVFAPPEARASV
jgi:hypothetical protein